MRAPGTWPTALHSRVVEHPDNATNVPFAFCAFVFRFPFSHSKLLYTLTLPLPEMVPKCLNRKLIMLVWVCAVPQSKRTLASPNSPPTDRLSIRRTGGLLGST